MIEKNGKIDSTFLGIEDHGIMTCWLNITYDGSGQGFGGYALDGNAGGRGHAKSILAIRKILETLDVRDWADLKGKYVRVRKEDEWNSPIHSIGHIVEDRWFSFKDHFKEEK